MEKTNRRKFLRNSGLALTGTLLAITDCKSHPEKTDKSEAETKKPSISKIADVRKPADFQSGYPTDNNKIRNLLQSSLNAFFDVSDPRDGLRGIFNPNDTIGIKVNCLSGRFMSTHIDLVFALVELLKQAGVKEDKIIIWDRLDRDLTGTGYKLNRGSGVKIYGVDSSGYSDDLLIHRSIGSFTASIMQRFDKIISMPVLKDHGIVGVTLGLKNFFGAIHNPYKYHLNGGDPYVADLYSHPLFKDKIALTIVDGIVGQYEGGPPHQPQWQWNHGGLLVGEDAVAVDRTGLDIIESKRREAGIKSLSEVSRYPQYLETAEKLRIGNFQKDRIEVILG